MATMILASALMLGHLGMVAFTMRPDKNADHLTAISASLGPGACQSCVPLTSQGSHFTAEVMIGTPPRPFKVVADTGSNSLIVPHCRCQTSGSCSEGGNCLSTTLSNSLQMLWEDETLPLPERTPVQHMLSFGSGQIQGAVGIDNVTVGECTTQMDDGLLLMVDTRLSISGFFGGILGLGLPSVEQEQEAPTQSDGDMGGDGDLADIIKQIMGGGSDDFGSPNALRIPQGGDENEKGQENKEKQESTANEERGESGDQQHPEVDAASSKKVTSFLDQANIDRFSMCFSSESSEGVLRFNPEALDKSLATVGKEHWGVDFQGISVGDSAERLSFCLEKDMSEEQETPCGMIPDSGTTFIMGPSESVDVLLESICDGWDHCAQNYSAFVSAVEKMTKEGSEILDMEIPWDLATPTKVGVLKFLLMDCASWLTDVEKHPEGLNELPTLRFHVHADGETHELQLSGADYIFNSSDLEDEESVGDDASAAGWFREARAVRRVASLLQQGPHQQPEPQQSDELPAELPEFSCLPGFGAMEYPTTKNGDVWIFGLPLFYKYEVHYGASADPPTVGFKSMENSECGSCGAEAAPTSNLQTSSTGNVRKRLAPRLTGKPRVPQLDTSRSL